MELRRVRRDLTRVFVQDEPLPSHSPLDAAISNYGAQVDIVGSAVEGECVGVLEGRIGQPAQGDSD